ncbi:MAG: toll/interleukin-1 receptor domain-containing protein [Bacteroidota bacterium]
MIQGYNKANLTESREWQRYSNLYSSIKTRPCIFLSHKKEDKPACREIAKYLKKAGIDYYLDEEDSTLQTAVQSRNPHEITESIKKGIRNSSHMLCVISEKTYRSNWVPFEVGYGHAAIIDKAMVLNSRDKKIKLSILTLKDLSEKSLPEYMQVGYLIRGTSSLNDFISEILGKSKNTLITESRMFSNTMTSHPLDNVLNWKK